MSHNLSVHGRDFFGPSAWRTIHSAAATYDPSKRSSFKAFIENYFANLPCKVCSGHALKNLKDYPIDQSLGSAEELFFWTYSFHDMVNKQINKANKNVSGYTPKVSPDYITIKKMYFDALTGDGCKDCGN
jgi:excinuclease UvrABC ATPase subunit